MDLGVPLREHGPADIEVLRDQLLRQPMAFWDMDRASRLKNAGKRPGDAVFYYNDMPACISRRPLAEAESGYISVLRYPDRPLFGEIQELIETFILPLFPTCDLMRVQLAQLPPGAVITPHMDTHILALIHRLHVPLVTHDKVKFTIAEQTFFLKEGLLYDLNNTVLHSVENQSDIMRVHLMVDMLPHSVARIRYYDSEEAIKSAVARMAVSI